MVDEQVNFSAILSEVLHWTFKHHKKHVVPQIKAHLVWPNAVLKMGMGQIRARNDMAEMARLPLLGRPKPSPGPAQDL